YRFSVVLLVEIAIAVVLAPVPPVREVAAVATLTTVAAAITLAAEVSATATEAATATAALRFDEVVNRVGTAGAGTIRRRSFAALQPDGLLETHLNIELAGALTGVASNHLSRHIAVVTGTLDEIRELQYLAACRLPCRQIPL